jgi:peptidoglycan/LPS O-acetylase OafA/YrhL
MLPPRQPRYESLDIWRGVACLLVVLFHSSLYLASENFDARLRSEGGSVFDWAIFATGRFWIGVPLFFVVSGFCIAASADGIRNMSGGAGRYFTRRARRIYPPLWAAIGLAVVVTLALPGFAFPGTTAEGQTPLGSPAERGVWQWLGNFTLTESWRPGVGGPDRNFVMGQLWTLCYEEQFYLVVGFALLVARRWFFTGVWVITGLVLFNLSSLNPFPIRADGVFIDGLWIAFAAGVAAYYRLNYATRTCGIGIEVAMLVLGCTSLASDANPLDTRQTLLKYNGVACLFAVLLCRLRCFDATLAGSRWTAPLRFCGRMCYSLYLTHPLVAVPVAWVCYSSGLTTAAETVLVTLPLCTLLSVALGHVFYRVIERRFLNSPPAPKAVVAEKQVSTSVPCPA